MYSSQATFSERRSMVKQCTDEGQKEAESVLSILAFEEGVSFLTYREKNNNNNNMNSNEDINGNSNGQTLEPATLVYHESAREIVFRDHVRRSHGDHSSFDQSMKNIAGQASQTITNSHKQFAKSPTLVSHDDESFKSHDSASKKSRNSLSQRRRRVWRDNAASVDSSNHSVSSIDTSTHNNGYVSQDDRKEQQKPHVVIANFTPEIDPLPLLELNSYNEFTELLNSKPFQWNEGEGPNEAKINQTVWDQMNTKEQNVVNLLLHGKCVVKTVKKADWTSFLSKFVIQDSAPRRYLHPADLKSASKEERRNKWTLNTPDSPFNSFMTSTSLLPTLGMKMRCYGSTKEYCHGVVFALPTDGNNEDETARMTSTWAWPSGM